MLKKLFYLITLICFAVVLNSNLFAKVVDKTVAIVDGKAIMASEFEEIMEPVMEQFRMVTPKEDQTPEKIKELRMRILDQMIDDKLTKQEAKKKKIRVAKREVEQAMEQIKRRFPSEEAFKEELKKGNVSLAEFEKRTEEQLMVMKLVEQEIKAKTPHPKEDEIKDYFDKIEKKMAGKNLGLNKTEEEELGSLAKLFKRASSEKVRARHILIAVDKDASMQKKSAALKKIKDVKNQLDKGAEFEVLAEKYSDDPSGKRSGGDLGFFARADMVPEFSKAAFVVGVGKVSNPVQTEFGYHLIKVEEKRAARKLKFDDVKNDIKEFLFQKKAQEQYDKWMKKLKSKATIKINSPE
ncbi:peptidylprolyl isomerase [Elusimicrobiota bacterium]